MQCLREVHRVVQRGHEHHAAEPHAISARRGEGHRLERAELRPRTQRLLLRPGAVETELLGADKIGAESPRIELAVRVELRNGDREPHGPIVSAAQPGTSANGSAKTTCAGYPSPDLRRPQVHVVPMAHRGLLACHRPGAGPISGDDLAGMAVVIRQTGSGWSRSAITCRSRGRTVPPICCAVNDRLAGQLARTERSLCAFLRSQVIRPDAPVQTPCSAA
jgi:hypothetical protein